MCLLSLMRGRRPQGNPYHTKTVAPNVNSNPLPNHGGVTINMIAADDDWCVIKNGFELGFGLGKHFQGIVESIQVPTRGTEFGLGYVPTDADEAELIECYPDQCLTCTSPSRCRSTPSTTVWGKESWACSKKLTQSWRMKLKPQEFSMPSQRSNWRIGPLYRF
uniref:Uncharacterized protein n=1 Tax=Solanum tuberosum TaxID=4113 RepID=M1DGM6_SOLTU